MASDHSKEIVNWIPKEFSFEWCMSNFSYNNYLPFRSSVTSPELLIGLGGDCTRWQLTFYPCGFQEENFMAAYLTLCFAKRKNLLVSCEFSLSNSQGLTIACVSFGPEKGLFNTGHTTGFDKLVLREHVADKISSDDILMIQCNIKVYYRTQKLSHRLIPNRISTVAEDFTELRRTGDFSDVTILIDDVEFRAHKNILSARSSVFAAMFKNQMTEANSGYVQIEDIEPEVFEEFLNYIYSGVANVDDHAIQLLAAADKYEVMDLKSCCETVLIKTMSKHNCFEMLTLSDTYCAHNLKEETVKFIASDISETDLQRLAEFNDSSLLLEIIQALTNKKQKSYHHLLTLNRDKGWRLSDLNSNS